MNRRISSPRVAGRPTSPCTRRSSAGSPSAKACISRPIRPQVVGLPDGDGPDIRRTALADSVRSPLPREERGHVNPLLADRQNHFHEPPASSGERRARRFGPPSG